METMLGAMYSRPDGSDGRESRELWVADFEEGRVYQETGWSCAPNNPDYWWFPDTRSSICMDHGCFDTEHGAKMAVANFLMKRRADDARKLMAMGIPL